MSSSHEHDPVGDSELRGALLQVEGDSPWTPGTTARLRASVMARAELPLARRRRQAARGRSWSGARPFAPLLAAAGLGGILLLGTQVISTGGGEAEGFHFPAAMRPAVEEILGARISEEEFRLFTGEADAELLLTAAIDLD
jgi:hypothetical protein